MLGAHEQHGSHCLNENALPFFLKNFVGNDDARWKAISLFHVTYPSGDLLGKILAYSSLLPMAILIGFITLILFRRELNTMAFFIGMLLNEVLNMILKHSIKGVRPCRPGESHLYEKYGMPSSHAQFMGFFALYISLFAYIRLKSMSSEKFMDNIRKHLLFFGSMISSVVVSFSRIYLRYHSLEQVILGLIVGIVAGSIWFFIVGRFLTPFYQGIVNSKIGEYFSIRDSSSIPDIIWFEYTATRTESRQRTRRATQKKSQ